MVLWENLADPILTGREQLGFSKIWCELPEPVEFGGETRCSASWLGFRFLDVTLRGMEEADPQAAVPTPVSARRQRVDRHAALQVRAEDRRLGRGGRRLRGAQSGLRSRRAPPEAFYRGEGEVVFHRARWEDLPTQYMVVNALHELEIKEYRGATIQRRVGGGDLIGQRIVA